VKGDIVSPSVALAFAITLASSGAVSSRPAEALRAPTTGSAVVGLLGADGRAEGTLVATSDGFAFHAFVVDVPADAVRWTLELDADADLDLALRFGAIGPHEGPPGGDWDRFDVGAENPTVVVLERPWPGRWTVVVVAPLEPGAWGTYALVSAMERGQPADVGIAGTFRCRDGDALLRLRLEGDGRIVGTLEGPRVRYVVDAVATLDGAYGVIRDEAGWVGFLARPAPAGLAVVLFELDAESRAIEESAWWIRFDRIVEGPGP
jgi:hypothetical protein